VRLPLQYEGDPFLCAELEGVKPVYTDDGMLVSKGIAGAFEVMCPIPALIDLLFVGIMAGVALAELVDDPVTGLPVLTPRDLHFLRYDFATHTWFYQGGQDTYVVDPGNGRWVLFCPESDHRPWKAGAWLPCSLPFTAKLAAVFDRLRWQAQLADPLKYFETTGELAEPHRISLEDFLNNLWARAPGIVLPPGAKAGVLEIDGKGYEVYEAAEKWADQQESKALSGGQSVTSDGKGGLSDGGDLFSEIAENIIVNTAAALGQCITRQVIAPWARARYAYRLAMNGDCPPSVSWDARSPARRAKDAEVLGAFADSVAKADAMLEKRGAMLDVMAFAEQCGVSLPVMRLPGASPPGLPASSAPGPSDDGPPADDAAALLAEKMTQYAIPRCEHGALNRCRLCGVERVRDFAPGPDGGAPAWRVAWRPIAAAPGQPKTLPPAGSVLESQ